jgi:phage-related protein
MSPRDKPLVWLRGEIKTPPFGSEARIEAGFLLRRLQGGESLGLPHSRPMPIIGASCHDLRIVDAKVNWRIMYHIAIDAVGILEVFKKQTETTPSTVIAACQRHLKAFQRLSGTKKDSGHAQG